MFPLGTTLLPGEVLPLRIFEPRYRQMLDDCVGDADDPGGFGVVLIARGQEVGGGDVRNDVGTFAQIEHLQRLADGRSTLTCVGTRRFRVTRWLPDDPYPRAEIEWLTEPVITDDERAALDGLSGAIRGLIDEVATLRGLRAIEDMPGTRECELATHGLFGWAAQLPMGAADRQRLVECGTVSEQLAVLHEVVEGMSEIIRFGQL